MNRMIFCLHKMTGSVFEGSKHVKDKKGVKVISV